MWCRLLLGASTVTAATTARCGAAAPRSRMAAAVGGGCLSPGGTPYTRACPPSWPRAARCRRVGRAGVPAAGCAPRTCPRRRLLALRGVPRRWRRRRCRRSPPPTPWPPRPPVHTRPQLTTKVRWRRLRRWFAAPLFPPTSGSGRRPRRHGKAKSAARRRRCGAALPPHRVAALMAAATGAMRAHPAAATAKAPSRRATRGWVVTVLDEAAGRAAVGVDRSTLRASHGGALIQFDAPDAPGTPKRAVGAAGCVWRQLGAAAAAAPQLKAGGGGGAGGAYGAAGEQPAAVGAATRAPAGPLSATGGQSAARRGGGAGVRSQRRAGSLLLPGRWSRGPPRRPSDSARPPSPPSVDVCPASSGAAPRRRALWGRRAFGGACDPAGDSRLFVRRLGGGTPRRGRVRDGLCFTGAAPRPRGHDMLLFVLLLWQPPLGHAGRTQITPLLVPDDKRRLSTRAGRRDVAHPSPRQSCSIFFCAGTGSP